jgi:7-keto-8-aminopelargonate synthetase-like enzyme
MEGDIAPLVRIVELAEQYSCHVIVDEAHATGCYGSTGSGLVDHLNLRSRVLATMHTGGKAMGVTGAYVCGSRLLRELLINRCRHFMFSTALPPAVGAWWLDAIARVQSDSSSRELLHGAAGHFRAELERRGIQAGGSEYIVPIIIGSDRSAVQVAERLCRSGWDVRAIRPPTVPEGTARIRISVHADHSPDLLSRLASELASVLHESLP